MDAVFSEDRAHRYLLTRIWDEARPIVNFILLNPSTADEVQDDPTIRRCIGYAKAWMYGGLWITNIFAYRATDPAVMKRAQDPVGPDNDLTLVQVAARAKLVVAGWGTHGAHLGRSQRVQTLLEAVLPNQVQCLAKTKDGEPGHPLYLPARLRPFPFWPSPKTVDRP